jgi:hypothetical protein
VELEAKEDILWVMWCVLEVNPTTKIVFGEANGLFPPLAGFRKYSS